MGTIYHDNGQVDSMIVYYEKVKRLAKRHKYPVQEARINSFYATYYANQDSTVADVELYTFGGQRAALQIEQEEAANPGHRELHDGRNTITLASLGGSRWRLRLILKGPGTPAIRQVRITPKPSGA